MRWKCLSNQQPAAQQPIRVVVARQAHRCKPYPRDAPSDAPDCLFVRRHRAYAPMVLPCMRADAVLMLLPAINSSSRDSARSDSTASPGASLGANSNQTRDSFSSFRRRFAPKCLSSQQPTAQRPVGSGRESTLHWLLVAGCWLLEHFQRIKNSFYFASAGRRNF